MQLSSKAPVGLRLVVRLAGLHKPVVPTGIRALTSRLRPGEGLRVIEHGELLWLTTTHMAIYGRQPDTTIWHTQHYSVPTWDVVCVQVQHRHRTGYGTTMAGVHDPWMNEYVYATIIYNPGGSGRPHRMRGSDPATYGRTCRVQPQSPPLAR